MTKTIIRSSLITFSIVATVLYSGQAAASSCKGLEASACSSDSSCSWVGGYERKDGRKVSAFCRAKPKSKNEPKALSKNNAAFKSIKQTSDS